MIETITDLLAIITAILFILLMFTWLILTCISEVKTRNMRDEYIKTLDDHDKSVIATYKSTRWKILKDKKK